MNYTDEEFKIMILDDDQCNTMYLKRLLRFHGYNAVITVTDSRLAVQNYKRYQPDLLLLDLDMPHLNGFDVLEELNGLRIAGVPAIMITAQNDPQNHIHALKIGVQYFLGKPFDPDVLMDRILKIKEKRHVKPIESDTQDYIMLKSFEY